MLLMPDPDTAVEDPFRERRRSSSTASCKDPITGQPYDKDPRYVAKKAEAYLKSTGIADTSYWGPEAEFYIFDSVRFDQNQHSGYYYLDSDEGAWNSRAGRAGGQPRPTSRATRRATSRSRPPTTSRTCAPR